jgi:wobble nucleotide-excising tRNase
MTLEEFAKEAGCVVSLHPGPENWGGKYQYHIADNPDCHFCGYKTEAAAYKGWLESTFGPTTAKAIIKLLRKSK